MKKAFLLVSLSILIGHCFAQKSASKEHVKTLLEVTGSAKVGLQVMSNMISTMKKSHPSIPEKFWDDFLKEAKPEEMIDLMIPIYAKHFTDEDVIGLIEFYNTPLGKKVTSTLPLIAQESYSVGAEWGKKIATQIIKKLEEQGYSQSN
jgi:uncharacterized protein